jgi:hypothetical protein
MGGRVQAGIPLGQSTQPQIDALRKSILASIYTEASNGPNFLDGAKLAGLIDDMPAEVRRELLGGVHGRVLSSARTLGIVQGKIPISDFEMWLRRSDPEIAQLDSMFKEQKKLDQLYSNNVIKRFIKGEISGSEIQPSEFVSRWLDDASAPEIRQVVGGLAVDNPGVLESIQRLEVQKILAEATPILDPKDLINFTDPAQLGDGKRLATLLRDPAKREKMKELLGNETVQFFESFAKAQAMFVKGEAQAAGAGGIAGSFMLLNILRTVTNLPLLAKHKFMSVALTNPAVRKMLMDAKPPANANWTSIRRGLIASEPFLAALAADSAETAKDGGLWMAHKIVDLINRGDEEESFSPMTLDQLEQELQQFRPQETNAPPP